MPTYNFPRLSVQQKPQPPASIQGVSTSIAFILGRSKRGRSDKPLSFSSLEGFQRLFGSSWDDDSYVPEVVKSFFDAAGRGSTMYFSRCLGSGGGSNVAAEAAVMGSGAGTKASITGTDGPWDLDHGTTFTASVDGGGAATATIAAFRAAITGAGATYAAVTAGHKLAVQIGSDVFDVVFTGAENTQAAFLSVINASILDAAALNAAGQVKLQTDQYGSGAAGAVLGSSDADVLTSLGLTASAFTAGGVSNVADSKLVQPSELLALFESAFAGASGTATADSITFGSDTVGGSSTFQFTTGTGVALVTGFDNAVHTGAGASAQPALTFTATGVGDDYHSIFVRTARVDTVVGKLASPIAPGPVMSVTVDSAAAAKLVVGDQISITDGVTTIRGVAQSIVGKVVTLQGTVPTSGGTITTGSSKVVRETFDLSVLENGRIVQGPFPSLRMSDLSVRNFVGTRVNTGAANALVTVESENPAIGANSYDVRPVDGVDTYLSGGSMATTFTDADYIGSSASKTGIYATDLAPDAVGAAAPGLSVAVQEALASYGKLKEAFQTVVTTESPTDDTDAAVTQRVAIGANDMADFVFPWVKVTSPDTGALMDIPAVGYRLGVYARLDRTVGLQKAPAGLPANLPQCRGLSLDLTDDDWTKLTAADINYIRSDKNGIRFYGSRTCDQSSANSQVSYSRLFIFIRRSLYEGLEFVMFDGNTRASRAKATSLASNFLRGLWRKDVLDGASEAEAFVVKCDEDNNPPEQINAGVFTLDAGARTSPVIEFADVGVSRIIPGTEASLWTSRSAR